MGYCCCFCSSRPAILRPLGLRNRWSMASRWGTLSLLTGLGCCCCDCFAGPPPLQLWTICCCQALLWAAPQVLVRERSWAGLLRARLARRPEAGQRSQNCCPLCQAAPPQVSPGPRHTTASCVYGTVSKHKACFMACTCISKPHGMHMQEMQRHWRHLLLETSNSNSE